jgi:hypothetical protein
MSKRESPHRVTVAKRQGEDMSDSWTIESAIWQIRHGVQVGDHKPERTESAEDWLDATIAKEVQSRHPIMTGAIAEMLLDALIEEVEG